MRCKRALCRRDIVRDLSDALFSCLHGGKPFSGSFYEDCCNRDDHCNNLDWPLMPLRLIVLVEWLCEAELPRYVD